MGKFQPFSRRDYDKLVEAERTVHDLLPMFDSAEACGVDCAEFRELAEEFRKRFSAIKTQFMSPPPSK